MSNLNRYHILIKDLVDGIEEWFTLDVSKWLSIQSLAPVLPKQSQWEVTMWDLTNSSVFVQYNWSWHVAIENNEFVWPSWVKYWSPSFRYSQIYPTWAYWYWDSVDTVTQKWEIRLSEWAIEVLNFPYPEDEIYCYYMDWTRLYVWLKSSAKVLYTDDKWVSWTTLVNFSDWWYTDYTRIKDLYVVSYNWNKKLLIYAQNSTETLWNGSFQYILGNRWWVDKTKQAIVSFQPFCKSDVDSYTLIRRNITPTWTFNKWSNNWLVVDNATKFRCWDSITVTDWTFTYQTTVTWIAWPFTIIVTDTTGWSSLFTGWAYTISTNSINSIFDVQWVDYSQFDFQWWPVRINWINNLIQYAFWWNTKAAFVWWSYIPYDWDCTQRVPSTSPLILSNVALHVKLKYPVAWTGNLTCYVRRLLPIINAVWDKWYFTKSNFSTTDVNWYIYWLRNTSNVTQIIRSDIWYTRQPDISVWTAWWEQDTFPYWTTVWNSVTNFWLVWAKSWIPNYRWYDSNSAIYVWLYDMNWWNISKLYKLNNVSGSEALTFLVDVPECSNANWMVYNNWFLFFNANPEWKVFRYNISSNQLVFEEVYKQWDEDVYLTWWVIYNSRYYTINPINNVAYAWDTIWLTFKESFSVPVWTFGIRYDILINLWDRLIIETNLNHQTYKYVRWQYADRGYLVSSIYWAYLGSVKKNWLYAKVFINKQSEDYWQKIRLAVSFDWWETFHYLPKTLWSPTIPDNFDWTVASDYEFGYSDFIWDNKNELLFWFPYDSITYNVCYKIEMFKWTAPISEFNISQIELHYQLYTFKEYYMTYNFKLVPKMTRLDWSITQTYDEHLRKFEFLKTIWREWRKVQITLPWWEKLIAVPFAPAQTWSDWFVVTALDTDQVKKDIANIWYLVNMSFKSFSFI